MALLATYPTLAHDWLKHEHDPRLYREEIVVKAGAGDLKTGTVLGKITASGKYVPYDPAADDGSESVAGLLLYRADASGADDVKAVRVMGFAEIASLHLSWKAGLTDPQKTAGLAALVALNFRVRPLA